MADRRDIGRFVGAELIGRGGFGSVYRASDPDHGRDVAIKVLRGALDETERRRFDRERQTMGRLGSHPNIIPVHESGYTDHGEGFLVMELAPGGSLGERLSKRGPLPWNEAVTIAAAIARAGQAAHDQGVLHRDIKPDNILIDTYGNPRLTDFGIASVASNATATSSTTATLAHAAPEVLEGETPSPAVDIYAIGSTAFNLITGSAPFQRPGEGGVTALIARTLTEPPPDLRPHGVPDGVATVIERALAKRPVDRQPTASRLADELDTAMATATSPRPAPGPVANPTIVAPAIGTGGVPAPGFDPDATLIGRAQVGGPGEPQPRRSMGTWLVLGAVAALLVIASVVATALILGGDGSTTAADETSTTTTTATTTPGDDLDENTTTSAAETTSSSGDTTTTTAAETTTTSSTVTTSVTTAPLIPGCGTRVVDGLTTRFEVEICAASDGSLTYRGANRTNDDEIEIPACFVVGTGVFIAENNGFTYLVDTDVASLVVLDPQGAIVVDEPFVSGPTVDFSIALDPC